MTKMSGLSGGKRGGAVRRLLRRRPSRAFKFTHGSLLGPFDSSVSECPSSNPRAASIHWPVALARFFLLAYTAVTRTKCLNRPCPTKTSSCASDPKREKRGQSGSCCRLRWFSRHSPPDDRRDSIACTSDFFYQDVARSANCAAKESPRASPRPSGACGSAGQTPRFRRRRGLSGRYPHGSEAQATIRFLLSCTLIAANTLCIRPRRAGGARRGGNLTDSPD